MKKLLIFILFVCLLTNLNAQHLRGLPVFDAKAKAKTDLIPVYKVPCSASGETEKIPKFIDNSTSAYFPAIFSQKGNSCAQASAIRYIFSYEINALRDKSAETNDNVYSSQFTWHFLNHGTDMGSFYWDGLDILKDAGVPSLKEFNDEYVGVLKWMNGYDLYLSAMHNRVDEYFKIVSDTDAGIRQMKEYLFNRTGTSKHGGLLVFAAMVSGWELMEDYTDLSHTGYQCLLKKCSRGGPHAMTIVGYDDAIKYDENADGFIGEGERGAFICVNSWGSSWGSNGRFYIPYSLFKKDLRNGGTGNGEKDVYGFTVKDVVPKLTFKVKIRHSSRDDFKIRVGMTNNENASEPTYTKVLKVFNHQGGNHPFGLEYVTKELEIGVDASELLKNIKGDKQSFFFELIEGKSFGDPTEKNKGEGKVISCSLIDYRGDKPIEYFANRNCVLLPSEKGELLRVSTKLPSYIDKGESSFLSFGIAAYQRKQNIVIYLDLKKDQSVRVELLNKKGEIIRYFFDKDMKAGRNCESLRLKDIKDGDYAVRVITDSQLIYKRITVKNK
jgi:hypothetical protein